MMSAIVFGAISMVLLAYIVECSTISGPTTIDAIRMEAKNIAKDENVVLRLSILHM